MTRLLWSTVGERFFETGVDRGVLYYDGLNGVSWSGLTAIKESPKGGSPKPFYIDGYKYANIASSEEYEATLEAFSSPSEFDRCDGRKTLGNGLIATQQPRKPFALSYRSIVGNDIDGTDHGYKIHLVYGALADPADRDNSSISDSPTPTKLSWKITTVPPRVPGIKPTSHFEVDTRRASSVQIAALENFIYGTDMTEPKMPTPTQLIAMFS